jgi:putative membrane protein (TIGR04086 family)
LYGTNLLWEGIDMNFNTMRQAGQTRLGSPMLSGLAYAFIGMALAALLASVIMTMGDQGEDVLPTYAYIIHGISALLGSFVSGRKSGSKGWYYGGMLGVFYSIIVLVVGFLSFDRGFDWNTLLFVAGAFLIGAAGGIMGVNTRK